MKSILNGVALFIQLATGKFTKQPDFDEGKNRFKFLARGLLTFPYTIQWLTFLNSHPEYKTFLWQNPRIASKLHRPYMIRNGSLKLQLQILTSHYAQQAILFPPDDQQCLLAGKDVTLCQFLGKHEKEYTITLKQNLKFQKEGELAIQMNIGSKALCIISFSFHQTSQGTVLLIGGLQGPEHQDYELVKEATKACYGLFPKKLTAEILTECAHHWRMRIHAISNKGHIYQHWRYNKPILANYDHFWIELGSHQLSAEFYEFPQSIYHKPLEQIESKKRSEHKKRYVLLSDLRKQLSAIF